MCVGTASTALGMCTLGTLVCVYVQQALPLPKVCVCVRTFANTILCCVGHEGCCESVHAVLVDVGQQDRLLCHGLRRGYR